MKWHAIGMEDGDELPSWICATHLVAFRMDVILHTLVLVFVQSSGASKDLAEHQARRVLVAVAPVFRFDANLGDGKHIFSEAVVHDVSVHTESGRVRLDLGLLLPLDSPNVEVVGAAISAIVSEPHACAIRMCPHCDVDAFAVALLQAGLKGTLPLVPA